MTEPTIPEDSWTVVCASCDGVGTVPWFSVALGRWMEEDCPYCKTTGAVQTFQKPPHSDGAEQ